MAFTWRNSTNTADLTTQDFATASTLTALLWWSRNAPGAGPPEPSILRLLVEDPDNPGSYLTSGHPALDAQEGQIRITSSSNPGSDPAYAPYLTGWTRLGTGGVLILPPMRGDCALEVEFRWVLSAGLTGSRIPFRYRLEAVPGSFPAVAVDAILGDGIVTSLGDSVVTEWLEHFTVTETGTPDDKANVPARRWLDAGVIRHEVAAAVTLNQNDSVPAALTAGQEYWAVLTQAAGSITTTKGVKATAGAAVLPAQPAGEPLIARVLVAYGAGGSVITTADITSLVEAGRYQCRAGTGLTMIVGRGRAWVARQWVVRDSETTVVTTASVTRYVWLESTGDVTQTAADVAPSAGALRLCTVTCDGSGVTALTDTRAAWWEPRAERLRLAQAGNEATGTDVARIVVDRPSCVDRGTVTVRTASAGATGSTDVTLVRTRAGTPADIATGTIPAGGLSAVLVWTAADLAPGDYLSLDVDAITSGGSRAADIAVCIVASAC